MDPSNDVKESEKKMHLPIELAENKQKLQIEEFQGKRTFVRHFVAILGLLSVVFANMCRQTFNQAITSMANKQDEKSEKNFEDSCPLLDYYSNVTTKIQTTIQSDKNNDKFDWSTNDIALLQMSFNLGYILLMVPAGRLSEIYGAYWVVLFCSVVSTACCFLSPLLAPHFYLLALSRLFLGLAQSGVSPSLYSLCAVWTRPNEAKFYVPMIRVSF